MFLFHKRTKNIIKYVWGFFAILIILSMVFTYSGFTTLSQSTVAPAQNIPPEVLAELQNNGTSTDVEALLNQLRASGTIEVGTGTVNRTAPPQTPSDSAQPPVPALEFGL